MTVSYSLKRLSTKRYTLLALILISLAVGLVILPENKRNEGISPEEFVKNTLSTERYINSDDLADRMINKDPAMILVDVRSEAEFTKYTLPNAINIPLEKFLDEENRGYFDQKVYDIILISNDQFLADQAWLLGNRLGYKKLNVLQGGLNSWFNTIVFPSKPSETMKQEDFEKYDFRKAAGMYFGIGTYEKVDKKPEPVKKVTPQAVVPKPKKKKAVPEGGC